MLQKKHSDLVSDALAVLQMKLEARYAELELNLLALTNSIPEQTSFFSEVEKIVKEQAELKGMSELIADRFDISEEEDNNG